MSDRKRRYKMVIPFVVLFCLLLFSFTAGAAESGTRVVRVGYPIQQGFTEIDEMEITADIRMITYRRSHGIPIGNTNSLQWKGHCPISSTGCLPCF